MWVILKYVQRARSSCICMFSLQNKVYKLILTPMQFTKIDVNIERAKKNTEKIIKINMLTSSCLNK